MLNNNILAGLIVIAPISIYYAYSLISSTLSKRNKNPLQINEVYWTNHLSNNCESKECKLNYCTLYRNSELRKLIDSAKYSIDIAMHIFTSLELSDAVSKANKRNVRVRIICCNLQQGSSGSQVWQLFDEGIEVRFQRVTGEQLMHHKFCIIDGINRASLLKKKLNLKKLEEPNSILITGSCNWTRQGLYTNWENIIVSTNEYLLNCFEKEFELMWSAFKAQT